VRSILPSSGALTCEGNLIHRGGTLATSEGKLFDSTGKLLAHGTETCIVIEGSKK
jgi:acyl-coenzyme A thioesterase PaaI-like protein